MAVTVAPDRKSVVINWQLTANLANVVMRSAGIYGPATKDQVHAREGVGWSLGIPCPLFYCLL